MRGKNVTQMGLFDHEIERYLMHIPVEKELVRVYGLLEELPELVECVHEDLQHTGRNDGGRIGFWRNVSFAPPY